MDFAKSLSFEHSNFEDSQLRSLSDLYTQALTNERQMNEDVRQIQHMLDQTEENLEFLALEQSVVEPESSTGFQTPETSSFTEKSGTWVSEAGVEEQTPSDQLAASREKAKQRIRMHRMKSEENVGAVSPPQTLVQETPDKNPTNTKIEDLQASIADLTDQLTLTESTAAETAERLKVEIAYYKQLYVDQQAAQAKERATWKANKNSDATIASLEKEILLKDKQATRDLREIAKLRVELNSLYNSN